MAAVRCATWQRVSTGAQEEKNQDDELAAHVAAHGYEVARRFVLHDVSASAGEQEPEMAEVLADITAGLYSVLVIVHSSRIDRREDLDAQARFVMDVRAAGGRIESVNEPLFGTTGLTGQLVTLVSQHNNAAYSVTLKGQIATGMRKVVEAGAFCGTEPWGLVSVGTRQRKRLIPTKAARTYALDIFTRVTAGASLRDVARWLTAKGVAPGRGKGKTGRKWYANSVALIIRNDVYAGVYHCCYTVTVTEPDGTKRKETLRWLHKWVPEGEPPLVPRHVVDAARQALDKRGEHYQQHGGRKPVEPLSGAARCHACGQDSPMYRITGHYGKYAEQETLRCTGRGADRKGCGAPMILLTDARDLADAAFAGMTGFFDRVYKVETIPGNKSEIQADRDEMERQRIELANAELPKAERRARTAELDAWEDRLDETEEIPDQREMTWTGETWGQLWARSDDTARAAILRNGMLRLELGPVDGTEDYELDGHGLWVFRLDEEDEDAWVKDDSGKMWSASGEAEQ